jgi:hypothetical protein
MGSKREAEKALDKTIGYDFFGRKLHVELSKKTFYNQKYLNFSHF